MTAATDELGWFLLQLPATTYTVYAWDEIGTEYQGSLEVTGNIDTIIIPMELATTP